MATQTRATRTPQPEPDWELVYKRNPVERLKRDKSPLGILAELPALIAAGYERMAEEDMVRLKWWGLYHDKPKVGTFMLRIKLPGGRVTPAGLRAIGEISNGFGRGDSELSTRQNVQLHWLELGALPEVFDRLHAAGLTSAGGCGDAVRNITGCPVAGLGADELFDAQPVVTRQPRSSTATRTTRTCRASTRSRSPPAPTVATRRRSTASPSSASCTTASRASPSASAAGSRPYRGSPATSASSSPRRR